VRSRGAGLVLRNFREIHQAVRELLDGLAEYRANVAKIENRAVFEIPEILARLLGNGGRATSPL
jgi:1,2-diacylglycerol 3-beta-galactosyltransferase